jgi:hypothetical protein
MIWGTRTGMNTAILYQEFTVRIVEMDRNILSFPFSLNFETLNLSSFFDCMKINHILS